MKRSLVGKTQALIPALVLGFSAFGAAPALAGHDISGGGNALVCFDTPAIPKQIRARDSAGQIIDGSIRNEHISHITRVEILDLVEAQYPRGMAKPQQNDLVQPLPGEGPQEYAERIMARVKDVLPLFYDLVESRIKIMPADSAVAQPDGLNPVDDYNLLGRIDSTNCVVGTVALHQLDYKNSSSVQAVQLYFDQRLMFHPLHSQWSRNVTYLHEVLYSIARSEYAQDNSQNTRKVIGTLLKKNLPVSELADALDSAGFNTLDYAYIFSQRYDRLGNVYAYLNIAETNVARRNLLHAYKERPFNTAYREEQLESATKDLKAALPKSACQDFKSCYDDAVKTSKIPRFLSGMSSQDIDRVTALIAKYDNFDAKIAAGAAHQIELASAALKDIYEKNWREKLLSISNIPQDDLKKLDALIEDTITNHMDLIVKRLEKVADDYREEYVDLFNDDNPALSNIPEQKVIP